MSRITFILLLMAMGFSCTTTSGQQEKDPKKFFGQIKNYQELVHLSIRSKPDSSEFHLVFSDSIAKFLNKYYHYYYDFPDTSSLSYKTPGRAYLETHVEPITVNDFLNNKAFVDRVTMRNPAALNNFFKSKDILFYSIRYSDSTHFVGGSSYWVYINNKWILFHHFPSLL